MKRLAQAMKEWGPVGVSLFALAAIALTLAVVWATRPPVISKEIKRVAPASPAGTVRVEVCEQAQTVTVSLDPVIGGDRYTAVGPVTLRWPDVPKADLKAGTWNPKALVEGDVADMTRGVIECLYREAVRLGPSAALAPSAPAELASTLYFPIDRSLFPRMLVMERDGAWPWSYEQWQPGGNILHAVATAFDDTSKRYGVYFYYDDTAGQRNVSASGSPFTARCGAGFAVACVGPDPPYYPLNADAYYDGPYMATFYFQSQTAIPKHEWKHVSTRRAEGTPSGTWAEGCVAFPSIMGCGPFSPKDYTELDDAAWAQEHYPAPVAGAAYNGGILWYARTTVNATRLAISLETAGFGPMFVGYAAPCTAAGLVCGGLALALPAMTCVSVKAENGISWARTDGWVAAGCSP
mgnify:CR=1 FL=1